MIRTDPLPPAPSLVGAAAASSANLRRVARALEDIALATGFTMRRISNSLTWGLATPERRAVILAGWEQRYYVRASMDPTVDAPLLALDVCASRDPETAWMGPAERAVVAAAVLRGHVEHHDGESADVLAWHRLIGTTCVEVSRG